MSNIIDSVKKIRDGLDIITKDETVSTVNRKTGDWEPHTISAIVGNCSQAKAIYLASKLMDLAKSSGDEALNNAIDGQQLLLNTSELRKNLRRFIINKIRNNEIGKEDGDDEAQDLDDELYSLRILNNNKNVYVIADREDGFKTKDDFYSSFMAVNADDVDCIIANFFAYKKGLIK